MKQTFRKKPVIIESVQWTGNNLKEVLDFTGKSPKWDQYFSSFEQYEAHVKEDRNVFKIFTLEGVMEATPGDWIIRGVKGEHYPCKPDIFQQTYESITAPAPPEGVPDDMEISDWAKGLVVDGEKRRFIKGCKQMRDRLLPILSSRDAALEELKKQIFTSCDENARSERKHLEKIDELRKQNITLQEEIERMRKGLEHIANPIAYLQSQLKPGEKLDGVYALSWVERGYNLSQLAKEFLSETGKAQGKEDGL